MVTLIPRCEKALLHLCALEIESDDSVMRFKGEARGEIFYHSLNSLPWGLSFTPLIMKLAKWQYSCAITFIRRS